jgi:ankyrin repeat protein
MKSLIPLIIIAIMLLASSTVQAVSFESLWDSARYGEVGQIKAFLEQNPKFVSLSPHTKMGNTLLHQAAMWGQVEVAKYLISTGADVNAQANCHVPPLQDAAYDGNCAIVAMLIDHGAKVNARDQFGTTALHRVYDVHYVAMQSQGPVGPNYPGSGTRRQLIPRPKDFRKLTVILVSKGADVQATTRARITPLHGAAMVGDTWILELLIKKGAKVNAPDIIGGTPLQRAVSASKYDAVDYLISQKADTEARTTTGATPIFTAINLNNRKMLKLLIARGVNVNARDKDGRTPLNWAIRSGYNEAAKILVLAGADVHNRDRVYGTPLAMATTAANREMVAFLRQHGAVR